MGTRKYDGPAIDDRMQPISEAPHWQGEGETVDVVDDAEVGEETVENVPVPDGGGKQPEKTGQTTLGDWEGSE